MSCNVFAEFSVVVVASVFAELGVSDVVVVAVVVVAVAVDDDDDDDVSVVVERVSREGKSAYIGST